MNWAAYCLTLVTRISFSHKENNYELIIDKFAIIYNDFS